MGGTISPARIGTCYADSNRNPRRNGHGVDDVGPVPLVPGAGKKFEAI